MAAKLKAIAERKVVPWTLAYLAGAWAVLEAMGFIVDLFGWDPGLVRGATVMLAAGLPAVLILAWYHGAAGRQGFARGEVGLLGVVVVAGILGAILVGAPDDGPDEPELSLAVLPPARTVIDPAEDYFASGIQEALISRLAQVGALRVISRRSTVRFADSAVPIPDIARALGVDAVVETALSQPGDSVHLDVRLVQAVPEERVLWSGAFAARIQDVPGMHGDITRAIARVIRVDLTADQQTRLASATTVDPETYEAYLRGMHALMKGTPADIERGLTFLHDAVDRSPADARAYAGLALGYATLGHGPAPPADAWPRALEAAERAVALDPDLAEAQAALADVKTYYQWDWAGAERAFRRANELNPSLAMNRYHHAWYLVLMGRLDEAIVEHRLAKELDPLTPLHTAWLGSLYIRAGRPEAGAEEARTALELDPDFRPALGVLGEAYLAMGRIEEALATHRRLAEASPAHRATLAMTLVAAGREDEARAIRTELEGREDSPWKAYALMRLCAVMGDYDEAFRWLAYEPHHAFVPWVAVNRKLEALRGDPRFQEFLRRLDLPGAHREVAER